MTDGGDPPCWAHLDPERDDEAVARTNGTGRPEARDEITDTDLVGLVEGMGEGVVIADPDGAISYWNQAATRIFGWTSDEAIGRTLDLIIPAGNRAAHWAGYRQVMQSGHTRYGRDLLRVPAVHKSGARLSIAFSVHLLPRHPHDLDGRAGPVKAIAAVVRDETERWIEERELRRRLADLEPTVRPDG